MNHVRNRTVYRMYTFHRIVWDCDWGEDQAYVGVDINNIVKEQTRLKKLSKKIDNGYPQAVYFSEKKQRYIRLYRSSRSSYLKKRNNRKVRRVENIPNGNGYRRVSEFWWDYC